MEYITKILITVTGLSLVWFSITCHGQCFTRRNSTNTCYSAAFLVEGVTSMMHCAYKCHRDERCLLFQHSETMRVCHGCIVFREFIEAVYDRPPDIVTYMRTLTGSANDDHDAVCLTSCEADLKPACQEITMNAEFPRNGTCFETCKELLGYRYYADMDRNRDTYAYKRPLGDRCLCGYSDSIEDSSDQCSQVCPKGDKVCDEMTVYKYRFGC